MAIDGAGRVDLFARSNSTATVTIDAGVRRFLVASITINMIDPLIDFDRDNAVVGDIFLVDGVRTSPLLARGDHWGDPGAFSNVHPGSFRGVAQRITFRLRVFGPDAEAFAQAIVIV